MEKYLVRLPPPPKDEPPSAPPAAVVCLSPWYPATFRASRAVAAGVQAACLADSGVRLDVGGAVVRRGGAHGAVMRYNPRGSLLAVATGRDSLSIFRTRDIVDAELRASSHSQPGCGRSLETALAAVPPALELPSPPCWSKPWGGADDVAWSPSASASLQQQLLVCCSSGAPDLPVYDVARALLSPAPLSLLQAGEARKRRPPPAPLLVLQRGGDGSGSGGMGSALHAGYSCVTYAAAGAAAGATAPAASAAGKAAGGGSAGGTRGDVVVAGDASGRVRLWDLRWGEGGGEGHTGLRA